MKVIGQNKSRVYVFEIMESVDDSGNTQRMFSSGYLVTNEGQRKYFTDNLKKEKWDTYKVWNSYDDPYEDVKKFLVEKHGWFIEYMVDFQNVIVFCKPVDREKFERLANLTQTA